MINSERNEKIGIGVITNNRLNLFQDCISHIPAADIVVVVNDGKPYPSSVYPSRVVEVIQHQSNQGVARSKNDALRFLLNSGCRHIFLCEDDMRIIHPRLCHEYVHASEQSGILHFNFGYHGPRNKTALGLPNPRKIVDYGMGVRIAFNQHLIGAFSYYRDIVLHTCGLIHPRFKNVLDHVDHTYRIIQKGFHPPFGWFADIAESSRFIVDLDPDLTQSSIGYHRWSPALFYLYNLYFWSRNGYMVQKIPQSDERDIDALLEELKTKYSKRQS
jgi:GT2 family glycosyltransferase